MLEPHGPRLVPLAKAGSLKLATLLLEAERAGFRVPRGLFVLEDDTLEQHAFTSDLPPEGEPLEPADLATELIKQGIVPQGNSANGKKVSWQVQVVLEPPHTTETNNSDDDLQNFCHLTSFITTVKNVNPDMLEAACLTTLATASQLANNYPKQPVCKRHLLILAEPCSQSRNSQHTNTAIHGQAFSQLDYLHDLVLTEADEEDKEKLEPNRKNSTGEPTFYALRKRTTTIRQPTNNTWQARVQTLLAQVRQYFGKDTSWHVSWADDGKHAYLTYLRPTHYLPPRNEVFALTIHNKVLPELPSRFMSSVIANCAPRLFNYYRQFDATLPETRAIIQLFQWRPYVNISLLVDMMHYWGLPTNIITDSLLANQFLDDTTVPAHLRQVWQTPSEPAHLPQATQPQPLHEQDYRPIRMLQKLGVLAMLSHAQMRAVPRAKQAGNAIKQKVFAQKNRKSQLETCTTFTDAITLLEDIYSSFVYEIFNLTASLSLPLLLLQRWKILSEHQKNDEATTATVNLLQDLEPLKRYLNEQPMLWQELRNKILKQTKDSPMLSVPLTELLPKDTKLKELWHDYMKKHGHRGKSEGDIAEPRLRNDALVMLALLEQTPIHQSTQTLKQPKTRKQPQLPNLRTYLTRPLWLQVKRTLNASETLSSDTMYAFAEIRTCLSKLAEQAAKNGQLPTPSDLWFLSCDEARALDIGTHYTVTDLQNRHREVANLKHVHLPETLHRYGKPIRHLSPSSKKSYYGISLTPRIPTFTGKAWCLNLPAASLPLGFRANKTILVTSHLTRAWLPTLKHVSGVVLEDDNVFSDLALLLCDWQIPTILNIQKISNILTTGTSITLDNQKGMIVISS